MSQKARHSRIRVWAVDAARRSMTARVFISYRTSDGADKATALARDLDALFGQEQIFLDKDDLPAGSRWRDEVARALNDAPILLVLVTPNYLGARDGAGKRCIEREDDPVRDELAAAIAANAHVIPLLCDGVAETPAGRGAAGAVRPARRAHLAAPARLRLARGPRAASATTCARSASCRARRPRRSAPRRCRSPRSTRSRSRRRGSASAAGSRLLGGAVLAARRRRRGLALAGREGGEPRRPLARQHRQAGRDARRATARSSMSRSSRTARSLRVASSAVNIEQDPDWQKYRALWQQRFGQPLNSVFYRGEGVLQSDEDTAPGAPPGPRRVLLSVQVDPPEGGAPIDTGALARHDRSRRQSHPRPALAQQRAGRARRRPAPRALGSPARQGRGPRPRRQRTAATVLPRDCAGAGSLASAAPALPSTGRRFSRHSGMPPRNQ